MVTQAIHDAQLLLRSHSSAGGRERDKERERDSGGKMVSGGPCFFFFVFLFFNHPLAQLEITLKFQLCHCENESRTDPSTNSSGQNKLPCKVVEPQATVVFTFSVSECREETLLTV